MNKLSLIALALFGLVLLMVAIELPAYGSFGAESVSSRYLESGAQDTGSANIVNAIVWDFRGYDTLGEETVLFTAALGIYLAAAKWRERKVK